MKTRLIVSSGQYETSAVKKTVNHKTWAGLCRRITQLENEFSVHGDNFVGWIKARVALADKNDIWGDNNIIGGRWCRPYHGWLTEEPSKADGPYMTYPNLKKKLGL